MARCSLPGPSSSAQKFADYLRSEWNYGVCDNTVLILVVVQKAQVSGASLVCLL